MNRLTIGKQVRYGLIFQRIQFSLVIIAGRSAKLQ